MKITLAQSLGMCFGVRDAIDLALMEPEPESVTILGQLVHNPRILRRLEEAGLRIAESPEVPVDTGRVIITAHGVSKTIRGRLEERGYQVQDATCPLVNRAHRALASLVAAGYFPVVIGQADHVEVRGLVGDLAECVVLERPDDVARLRAHTDVGRNGHARLGVVAQTTQPLDLVRERVEQIRAALPEAEIRFVDTVCRPTKERQQAARELARQVQVMVVIGGRNSNNTRQLARTCAREGATVYHVEGAADLQQEWFAGVEHVGITAGTSTPDEVIQEVCAEIERLG
ncbi:MAG: 4-hydroxy-3-methylbut-2-enyl diphosphate reductase [Armatimonadetes bacterium]|nr:4-hydroxy-3-methylbut-2-enyl diphosphate reductase [Armatimonadota bacterium]